MIDQEQLTRIIAGEYNNFEIKAAEASGDRDNWLARYSNSAYLANSLDADPEGIFRNYDSFHSNYFGEDISVPEALNRIREIQGIKLDSGGNPTFFGETAKSLTRGTISLVYGGFAGLSALMGNIPRTKQLLDQQRHMINTVAVNPEVASRLKEFRDKEGVLAQLTTSDYWSTKGAELVPSVASFFVGGLGAFKAAQLAFKGNQLLATIAAAGTLNVAESVIEAGGAVGEVKLQTDMANLVIKTIEGMDEEERDQIYNQGMVEALNHYKMISIRGGSPTIAGEVAREVFVRNVALNAIFTTLGLGFGKIAVSSLFSGTGKRRLVTAVLASGGAAVTEPEQELRQEEITDSVVYRELFNQAIDSNVLSIRILQAILSDNNDKKDTALAAFLMGSHNILFGFATEVSLSKSMLAAEKKMSEYIEKLRAELAKRKAAKKGAGTSGSGGASLGSESPQGGGDTKAAPAPSLFPSQKVDSDSEDIPPQKKPSKPAVGIQTPLDVLKNEQIETLIENYDKAKTTEERVQSFQKIASEMIDANAKTLDADLEIEVQERKIFEQERKKSLRDLATIKKALEELTPLDQFRDEIRRSGLQTRGIEEFKNLSPVFRKKDGLTFDQALQRAEELNLVEPGESDPAALFELLKGTVEKKKPPKLLGELEPGDVFIDEGGLQITHLGFDKGGKVFLDVEGQLVSESVNKLVPAETRKARSEEIESLIAEYGDIVELNPTPTEPISPARQKNLEKLGIEKPGLDDEFGFDAEDQLLFKENDPYIGKDVREDITDKQKELGKEAYNDWVKATKRIIGEAGKKLGINVLGSAINKDFIVDGTTSFVGKKIRSIHDLPVMAQIFRDPRWETLRVFYLKNNTIVGENVISSRLPWLVSFSDSDFSIIDDQLKKTGADRIYLLHNHPTGNPNPSQADLESSAKFKKRFPKEYQGEFIIDSGSYVRLIPPRRSNYFRYEPDGKDVKVDWHHLKDETSGTLVFDKSEVDNPLLGQVLQDSEAFVAMGKALQVKDGYGAIIGLDSLGAVRTILEVPDKLLLEKETASSIRYLGLLRKAARETGTDSVYLVTPSHVSSYKHLFKTGIFDDMISFAGITVEDKFKSFNPGIPLSKLQKKGAQIRRASTPEEIDPYENKDVREGTTEDNKKTGKFAYNDWVKASKRILGVHGKRFGINLIASAINRDFVSQGSTSFIGKEIDSVEDLAVMAQVFRDPRFETLRVFYLKNGVVAGEDVISSRLPNRVNFLIRDIDFIKRKLRDLEADKIYLLHNHPSGKSTPSRDDIRATQAWIKEIKEFEAHVVINSGEYSVIKESDRVEGFVESSTEKISGPLAGSLVGNKSEVPHELLGRQLDFEQDFISVGNSLKVKDGYGVIFGVDAKNKIRLITEVPDSVLAEKESKNLDKYLVMMRKASRETGVTGFHLVTPRSLTNYRHLLNAKIFRDSVSMGGVESAFQMGFMQGSIPRSSRENTNAPAQFREPTTEEIEQDIIAAAARFFFLGKVMPLQKIRDELKRHGIPIEKAKFLQNEGKRLGQQIVDDASSLPDIKSLKKLFENKEEEIFKRGFKAGEFTERARRNLKESREKEKVAKRELRGEKIRQQLVEEKKNIRKHWSQRMQNADELEKAARQFIKENKIPQEVRGQLIASIARLFKIEDPAIQRRQFEWIITKALDLKHQVLKREALFKINKKISNALKERFSKSRIKTGPLGQVEDYLKSVIQYIKLEPAEHEKAMKGLESVISKLKDEGDYDKAFELEKQLVDLDIFGNLQDRTYIEVERALSTLNHDLQGKRLERYRFIEDRLIRYDLNRAKIIANYGEVSAIDFEFWRKDQNKTPKQKFFANAWRYMDAHLSMEQKLERIAHFDRTGYLTKMVDQWRQWIWTASQKEQTLTRNEKSLFDEAAKRIWNLPDENRKGKILLGLNNADKKLAELSTKTIVITGEVNGVTRKRTVSYDVALKIYLTLMQPDLMPNMNEHGFDTLTRLEILNKLPDEVLQLGDWMIRRMSFQYNELNEIYTELFGAYMPQNMNYFPFAVSQANRSSEFDPERNRGAMNMNSMAYPGSIRARVPHKLPIDISRGAIAEYLHHQHAMARFKAFALGAKDFHGIFADPGVQRSLKVNLGEDFYNDLLRHASEVVSGGNEWFVYNENMNRLKNTVVYSKLGLNFATFSAQLASFPGLAMNLKWSDVFKEIVRGFKAINDPEVREEFMRVLRTDYVKNRWEGGAHIEAMWVLENSRTRGFWGTAARASLLPTRAGDLVPILVMGRVLYNHAFNEAKALGWSDAAAHSHAEYVFGSMTDSNQQSSQWKDRTLWQRKGTFGEVLSMFQTSPRQYFTASLMAVRRAAALKTPESRLYAAKVAFTMFVLMPVFFMFAKDFYKFIILGNDDDREAGEVVRDYLAGILSSPFMGLVGLSIIADDAARLLVGRRRFFDSADIAALSLHDDILRLLNAGYLTASGEDGELVKNVLYTFPALKQGKEFVIRE